MLRVYLETTIPSYLTARPSRDLVIAAHQEVTREWWDTRRHDADLYVSEYVIEEAMFGDEEAASLRMKAIEGIAVLDTTPLSEPLAHEIMKLGLIPERAILDAFHIAISTIHEMDVLLTWNCTHLANPVILKEINRLIRALGHQPPMVYTPDEMLGGE